MPFDRPFTPQSLPRPAAAARPSGQGGETVSGSLGQAGRVGLTVLVAAAQSGCAPLGAPSLLFFGAYFPSWLACALVGILGAVVVRVVFVKMGVDDVLPARLLTYTCIAAGIGFLASLLSFGR